MLDHARIEELLAQAREKGHQIHVNGPQSPAVVEQIEQALNVRLPNDFREFILRYGGMNAYDTHISGRHIVELTEFARDDDNVPERCLVLWLDANGDGCYCFDSQRLAPETAPVFWREHHIEGDVDDRDKIADSFQEFLIECFLKT